MQILVVHTDVDDYFKIGVIILDKFYGNLVCGLRRDAFTVFKGLVVVTKHRLDSLFVAALSRHKLLKSYFGTAVIDGD